jgi:endonuclease-3 related protein
MPATLHWLNERLREHFGQQHWWPAETPFEVMVGAILTQNTAWSNVEKAISNLRQANALSVDAIASSAPATLAEWIRPSGYFNIKAERLQAFCRWYRLQGEFEGLKTQDTVQLRRALLSVHGVGPETADDMLLYAFERPVFVVDAYTRRLFSRLSLIEGNECYDEIRTMVEECFGRGRGKVKLYNELHALIVAHAKDYCRKKPQCSGCPLRRRCPSRL